MVPIGFGLGMTILFSYLLGRYHGNRSRIQAWREGRDYERHERAMYWPKDPPLELRWGESGPHLYNDCGGCPKYVLVDAKENR